MTEAAAQLPPGERVVLVSGANRGIGLAIAKRLHADGYRLSLGARDMRALREATAGFDPPRTLLHPFDATKAESAAPWVDRTLERFGTIDALVNNAGILRRVNFEIGDEAVLDELWAVNVKAAFRMIRLCLPHLRKCGHGRIVNVASTDGKRYRDYSTSVGYAMTKHAVVALTHAARFAGWDDGVRATALCPGAVETDLLRGVPGVVPPGGRMSPDTIAAVVALVLTMPNAASIAEFPINARLEPTL
jgi:NAD(P)-dependent dehydrogenase (short-subunit alcohol dehydrogenase family)